MEVLTAAHMGYSETSSLLYSLANLHLLFQNSTQVSITFLEKPFLYLSRLSVFSETVIDCNNNPNSAISLSKPWAMEF